MSLCGMVACGWAQAPPKPPEAPQGNETVEVTSAQTGPYRPQYNPDFAKVKAAVATRTNAFRKQQKLEPLAEDDLLNQTAQQFAEFMAKNNRYGHSADGGTVFQRVEVHKYEVCYIGENIALYFKSNGYTTAALSDACFDGWKNSPGHRENMLRPYVTQTGLGLAQSADTGAFFAVQLVGRPKSQQLKLDVVNESGKPVDMALGELRLTLPPGAGRNITLCLPEDLKVTLPAGAKAPGAVPVKSGHRYTLRETDGQLRIEDQPPAASSSP